MAKNNPYRKNKYSIPPAIMANAHIENGTDGWEFDPSVGATTVARYFHGHYTIAEVEALLRDMRAMQKAVDNWTPPTAADVARRFIIELRETIGDKAVNDAARANRAGATVVETTAGKHQGAPVIVYDNTCATHDYCDANMVMDSALRQCGVNMEWDDEEGMGDAICNLWNAAWNKAKAAGFVVANVI